MAAPVPDSDLVRPDDPSPDAFLKRSALVDASGTTFREFRQTLTPRFGVVWTQLLLGYAALALVGLGVVATAGLAPAWARILIGAGLFGFIQAYIQLFFHEAAHYNLAPGREHNDRLANIFVGAIHGLEIAHYRRIHFDHHRHLGTTMDTERTYFDPLNVRFVAEALLGIKGIKVLARRSGNAGTAGQAAKSPVARRQQLAAAAIHLTIVVGATAAGALPLAIAWTLGTVSVMPLFVSVRQLLEHRSEHGSAAVDYTRVDHGSVNRLFGDGPFAATFGGAGFNRHLLHHWEPQISYTRLRELEHYLLRTGAAAEIRQRQTTYLGTFRSLVSW